MKRLVAPASVLFLLVGCATSGDQAQWNDFWKDVRGDNMKMRSGWSQMQATEDRPETLKAYD
jgi:hypothetical protein